jgi:hypothetical protein
MDLTQENKAHIDAKSYEELLSHWRFAEAGDQWFQGETGFYWKIRMTELRDTVDHVRASKNVGLDKPQS